MSGSGNNNVEIRISGTVDPSLTASTSAAAAQLDKITAAQATQTASAARMAEALKSVGGDLRKVTPEMLGLGSAGAAAAATTEEVAGAAVKADAATKGLRLTTSGMIQEYVRMARAIATGRFDILPSELATAASRMGGLSAASIAAYGPMIAVAAAAAAVAIGLGYVIVKAIEADQAISRIKIGADFAGNVEITRASTAALVTELESLSSVSSAVADQIVGDYSKMGNMSASSVEALSLATERYVQVTGEKAPQAVEAFTTLLNKQKLTLDDLQKVFPGITDAEAANFIQVQRLGDAHRTTAALVALLQERTKSARGDIIDYDSGWVSLGNDLRLGAGYIEELTAGFIPLSFAIETSIKLWDEVSGAMKTALGWVQGLTAWIPNLSAVERVHNNLLQESAAAYDAQTAAAARAAAQAGRSTKNTPFVSSEAVNLELQRIANDVSLTDSQILAKQAVYLQQQIALTRTNTEVRAELERSLAEKQTELARKTSSDLIATDRAATAQRGLIGKARIQAEIDTDRALLADTRITAENRLEIERDLGDKISQLNQKDATAGTRLHKVELDEHLRQLQEDVAATREGSQERIAAVQREVDYAIKAYGRLSAQAKAAQVELTTAERAYSDNAVRDLISVQDTSIKAANEAADNKIKTLNQAFQKGHIFAEQEIRDAIAVETARDQAVNNSLQVELAAAQGNEAVIRAVNAKIEAEAVTHQKRLDDITRQGVADQAAQWRDMNSEILSSENTLISGLLSGRQTLGQALLSMLGNLLEKEIEKDIAYWSERELLSAEGVSVEAATEKGGLLMRLIQLNTETVATVASQTAQTGAVVAGEAARVAAKTAAATAGAAVDVAVGSASILNDAYKAAAGAYSAVVGIPYVGPVLAPIAAATAFGAVAAFDTLTSFDVGTASVPRDMVAKIHKGERIIPAAQNAEITEALAGGGSGSGGGSNHLHVHGAMDGKDVLRVLRGNPGAVVAGLRAARQRLKI